MVAALADKNPVCEPNPAISAATALSINHGGRDAGTSKGEVLNVLWMDYHVSRHNTVLIGVQGSNGADNIFRSGTTPDGNQTASGADSHSNAQDSFLIGPY
jgi:hypothetical protein